MLAQFDEKRLNLKHVLQWPVTSKPWFSPKFTKEDQAVCPCLETIYNSYLLYHLQQQYQVSCGIVDAMRVVRMTREGKQNQGQEKLPT